MTPHILIRDAYKEVTPHRKYHRILMPFPFRQPTTTVTLLLVLQTAAL
jgi:hypothetical protein